MLSGPTGAINVGITASYSLVRAGAAQFDQDWQDYFSITPEDVIETGYDHSFERNLETSIDRLADRNSRATVAKVRAREKTPKAYLQQIMGYGYV
jgi:hypothetical protein